VEHHLLNLRHTCQFEKTPSTIVGHEPYARGRDIACPNAPVRADASEDQVRQEPLLAPL
jgi:hypothetical protein